MQLNAKQMAYLTSLGLTADASDIQAKAFVVTLGKLQRTYLDSLAEPDEPAGRATNPPANATPPATPPATPAGNTPPVTPPTPPATPATPPATDPQATVRDLLATERQRTRHAQAVATQLGLGETWAQKQVDGGFTVEQINAAALHQAAANRPPVPLAPSDTQVGVDRQGAAVAAAVIDTFIQRAGAPLLEIDGFSGLPIVGRTRQPHEWAGRFRGNSLMIAQQFLAMCGRSVAGMTAPQIAQALFVNGPRVNVVGQGGMLTSADFPLLLANAIGVSMQARYATYPIEWRKFAVDTPVGDFRTQSVITLGELPILPQVLEGGEYTYVTFGEAREQYVLAKRGHIVALSWEAVVNDQLGAFALMQAKEGDAAARTDDVLAFAVLTGNPTMGDTGALFNATAVTTAGGHANLVAAGSGAPPSATTYGAMILSMKTKPAPKKNLSDTSTFIVADPKVIICPVALEPTVDVLNVAEMDPALPRDQSRPNIYRSRFVRASHPLLDAVATSGAFSWFACTDPAVQPAMIMAYLDGMQGPQFTQESGFDNDSRKFKVTHCRAAKATDWRLWFCNAGY